MEYHTVIDLFLISTFSSLSSPDTELMWPVRFFSINSHENASWYGTIISE